VTDGDSPDSQSGTSAAGRRYLAALLSIDRRYAQAAFSLLLLGFVLTLVAISLTYDRDARLFPLVVAVPSLVILLVLLGIQTVAPLREYAERFGSAPTLSDRMGVGDEDDESEPTVPIEEVRVTVVRTLGWISTIAVSILLLGHVVGLSIALVVVFRNYSDLSWLRAIVAALVNVVLLTGLFVFVFNARLYPGLLLG
jgi:hypothetical protein